MGCTFLKSTKEKKSEETESFVQNHLGLWNMPQYRMNAGSEDEEPAKTSSLNDSLENYDTQPIEEEPVQTHRVKRVRAIPKKQKVPVPPPDGSGHVSPRSPLKHGSKRSSIFKLENTQHFEPGKAGASQEKPGEMSLASDGGGKKKSLMQSIADIAQNSFHQFAGTQSKENLPAELDSCDEIPIDKVVSDMSNSERSLNTNNIAASNEAGTGQNERVFHNNEGFLQIIQDTTSKPDEYNNFFEEDESQSDEEYKIQEYPPPKAVFQREKKDMITQSYFESSLTWSLNVNRVL